MIPPHGSPEIALSFRVLTVCLAVFLPLGLAAQDSLPPLGRDSAFGPIGVIPDSLPRIIRKIRLVQSDVFDSADAKKWFGKIGNGLHVMTRPGIVESEILFKVGEPYDSAKAAEMARNLRSRGLFRKVQIDTVTGDSGVILHVITKDGWTTQIDLRFRSAGKQTDWQVALIERNLLGTGTRFATRYRHTPDRNSLNFQFLQPRLVARRVSLGLRYEDRSDGARGPGGHRAPLLLATPTSNGLTTLLDIRNERVLQFRDGVGDPADSLRRRFVLGRLEAATRSGPGTRGYLRVGVTGQIRRDDLRPLALPDHRAERDRGVRAVHRMAPRQLRRDQRLCPRSGQDEDVDLSTFARIGLFAAPEFLGYDPRTASAGWPRSGSAPSWPGAASPGSTAGPTG